EEEEVVLRGILLGDGLDLVGLVEDLSDKAGDGAHGGYHLRACTEGEIAKAAKVERYHARNENLRGKGLGTGNADFRAGVLVDAAVTLASYGAADAIRDGECAVALTLGFAEGFEGVHCLTALRDDEDEGVFIERGVAVAE